MPPPPVPAQAMSLAIYGCFGMTELRGGTNVRALETVATYVPPRAGRGAAAPAAQPANDNDAEPDDGHFVLHTPSITALKWYVRMCGVRAK